MARESKLDGDIQALIRERGGWCVKTHGSAFMPAGTPDILACYRGRFIGIEDKVEGNKARAIQVKNLRDIAKAGGHHLVAYSVDDVRAVLDSIDLFIEEGKCGLPSVANPSPSEQDWRHTMWKTGNVPTSAPRR